MTSHGVGYGKPPESGRFRAGVSGNPKGRPKRKQTPLAEMIKNALNAPIEFRERGRVKVATFRELSLKTLVDRAVSGDLGAAELAVKVLAHAERHGEPSIDQILVDDWLADYPAQTAEQKTGDVAKGRDAKPAEWGGRTRIDRGRPIYDVRSIGATRPSHIAWAAPHRSDRRLLGVAAPPLQGASLRKAIRQDRVREDMDSAGSCPGGRMRLVRSPAYDLV
jgi:hypothetical protein